MNLTEFVAWFRDSSPYIHAHRGKTIVVMFGGETVADENFPSLIHDLALLNSLGIKLLLVHGARPQIEQSLIQANIETQIVDGLRVTSDEALPVIKCAVGSTRMDIEALLSMGVANSPMAGARIRVAGGNLVVARPLGVRDGVDFCHTGEVRRIDADAIRRYLDEGTIVLLSPIGYSPTGEVFSLGAEDVATTAAIQLKADKVIFVTDTESLTDEDGEALHELTVAEAAEFIQSKQAKNTAHIECALRAVRHGVRRAHILNRHTDGALLLELFTRNGVGTLVSSDSYDNIRQATIDDVGGVLELIEPLERKGTLVRRSRERLEIEIDHFTVMERDGMVIACAALYPFPEEKTGELACLVVHPDYQKEGRGDILLKLVEQNSAKQGLNQLFVLTTQTAHWFLERGFVAQELEKLPIQKRELYNYQRRSKIFAKTVEPARDRS